MAKVLNWDLKVSEFKLQSCYSIYFYINTIGKGINPIILPSIDQIVLWLFFYKDVFSIK